MMESIPIERLMQWNKSEGWLKYHNKSETMHLKLLYDQIFIIDGETILETCSLAGKVKGFCKNNVLILIVLIHDNQIRKVKFQFKTDPLKTLQILRNHFPIAGECNGKLFKESSPSILLSDVIKTALENCKIQDVTNMMVTSSPTENFVKLCLLDPSFPQFVRDTEKILKKFKPDGKASFLPKPRMAGSIDRHSVETRRPSGIRSSSADPPRSTISGMRLSREASATKIPVNRNSRSQQRESSRAPITPLRSSQFSRSTITPRKTPTEDRTTRGWQTSLDRALACVTMKDQRPISNAAWQRAECHRVQETLAERGGDGSTMTLIRPLTITRFVEIVAALLHAITRESKLNNDNYVTKIPHTAKLLLYPTTISKTWLKTVNTLHAFPQALAFIAYLMDLANSIELPIAEEWLYLEKDELAVLQRDYLYKCWYRFQEPEQKFDDLDAEYLHNLKLLLGNDDENIALLNEAIQKYELCLKDEAELAARADEERRNQRRFTLLSALRSEKAGRVTTCAAIDTARASVRDHPDLIKALDHDIDKANAESQQLRKELESQAMSVEERARRLDEVDYALRVHDSKRMLCEQITKMLFSKESELAFWQKMSLDCCVQYKQGLIHLAAKFPSLQQLAIDEQELMEDSCVERVSRSVEALKQHRTALDEQLAAESRARNTRSRQRAAALDELRSKIAETKSTIHREEEALKAEQSKEAMEAHEWKFEESGISQRIEVLTQRQSDYLKADGDKQFWLKQETAWKSQLSNLQKYIEEKKAESKKVLVEAKRKRAELVAIKIKELSSKIVQ